MKRRTFLWNTLALAGIALPGGIAHALGKDDRFTIAALEYDGRWNPRPTALRRLLLEVDKRTSIEVTADAPAVKPGSNAIFEYPFLYLAGDRKFAPWPDAVIENLRRYLQAGGFLVVDSAEGVSSGPFMKSVRREIARIYPDRAITRIPKDHVVYKSFYLIDEPVGRLVVEPAFEGIYDEDRLSVILSPNDMAGAWARDAFGTWTYDCTPGGDRQRELAYRLGINLVMYALCINYKADQVHVPFILKRRKWRVD